MANLSWKIPKMTFNHDHSLRHERTAAVSVSVAFPALALVFSCDDLLFILLPFWTLFLFFFSLPLFRLV